MLIFVKYVAIGTLRNFGGSGVYLAVREAELRLHTASSSGPWADVSRVLLMRVIAKIVLIRSQKREMFFRKYACLAEWTAPLSPSLQCNIVFFYCSVSVIHARVGRLGGGDGRLLWGTLQLCCAEEEVTHPVRKKCFSALSYNTSLDRRCI
jgi:hypothetical protein